MLLFLFVFFLLLPFYFLFVLVCFLYFSVAFFFFRNYVNQVFIMQGDIPASRRRVSGIR